MKPQLSFSELAEAAYRFATKIKQHTDARVFLQNVLQNRQRQTILHISEIIDPAGDPQTKVNMELELLPEDARELVLSVALDHEERMVFDLWQKLRKVVEQFEINLAKMKKDREEKSSQVKVDDTDDFPPVLSSSKELNDDTTLA